MTRLMETNCVHSLSSKLSTWWLASSDVKSNKTNYYYLRVIGLWNKTVLHFFRFILTALISKNYYTIFLFFSQIKWLKIHFELFLMHNTLLASILMFFFYYLCFVFVCHIVLSVPYSLVVICWERADLLALLCMIFSCVLSIFHNCPR